MPKYNKTNWIDGETVLKAEHMEKIEKGIVDLCEEIENVKVGDIDLSNYYTKSQTYNRAEIDNKIANMGNSGSVDLDSYVTKSELEANTENLKFESIGELFSLGGNYTLH